MQYTLRYLWIFVLVIGVAHSIGSAESVTAAQSMESGSGWVVTLNGGAIVTVPNDPANRHYVLLQQWITQGNTPTAAPAEDQNVTRRKVIESLMLLQTQRLALIEERSYWQGQGATQKVNWINSALTTLQTKIDDRRAALQ